MEKVQGLGFREYHRSRVLDLGLSLSFSAVVNTDEFLHQKASQGKTVQGAKNNFSAAEKLILAFSTLFPLEKVQGLGFRQHHRSRVLDLGLSLSFSAVVNTDEFLHQKASQGKTVQGAKHNFSAAEKLILAFSTLFPVEKVRGLGFSEYQRSRVLHLELSLCFSALVNTDEFLHQRASQGKTVQGAKNNFSAAEKLILAFSTLFPVEKVQGLGFREYHRSGALDLGLSLSFSVQPL